MRSARSRDEREAVTPLARLGSRREGGVERAYDGADLMVPDPYEHGAPVMGLAAFEPVTADAGEVGGVERHQETLLPGRKLQQLLVGAAVETALLVDGEHVVPAIAKGPADSPT